MESTPLSLTWFKIDALEEGTVQRIHTGFTSRSSPVNLESELTIPLQNATNNTTIAVSTEPIKYFCRVMFLNGTILSDSQSIYLFPPTAAQSLTTCEEGKVHSIHAQKCIDPHYGLEVGVTSTMASRTVPVAASDMTMGPPPGDGDSPDGLGLLLDTDLLLYAAIGAAVLLLLIVCFLVFCLCLCNKLCKKSGYCTCCV